MYLGIDVGTSGVKAVLIDEAQKVVGSATAALVVSRPKPGWSEQDPADWWQATRSALDELARDHSRPMSAVVAIGLSGQMHGATLLDDEDRVLRPAILWNDGRSATECAELDARADFRGIGGNLVMPGFTAPKLEWVRKHEADIFGRIAKVLLPKDYIRLMLTGAHVSDMSDSAGTLWLDVEGRKWSDALLAACGLQRSQMPDLVEGSDASAELKVELASRWGMAKRPVVAGGAGDNAASACGIGAVSPGGAFLSIGTSGVLFVSTDRFRPNTESAVHAFCHAIPDTWHQMGVILSATDSLNWLSRMTGSDPAALVEEAEAAALNGAGPSPVTFLPYLSGERTPHNDASARGAFAGLAQAQERADLTQAVLDGVAFAFRDCLDALLAAGTDVNRMTAVGGGARSRLWLKIMASVLERNVDVPDNGDYGAAFGAARLGMAAAGESHETIFGPPAITETIEPDARLIAAYGERLQRYRALYPSLKEVFS
ncbi:xylulokinase [Stappia sp. F7233]|uniref:Xylulose kinase n=1 Tax=Stappia albiluteola TaxID=2758565 RepID=A0A839AC64_9HYPH|nr:xylulokinase [Stappia albiluteola]MBA5776715.1 xylulokinase [Stappia albiluteola]